MAKSLIGLANILEGIVMIIDSSIVKYQQNSSVASKSDTASIQEKSTTSTTAIINEQSTSVSISGRSLMLSRLFGNKEPTVKPSGDLLSLANLSTSPAHFLTESDKDLLSKMYEFAQQQGADLQHVDSIGVELGSYRKADNGKLMSSFNNGQNFDLEGHQVTLSFNEQNTKTVARILNSESINSTQLDHGFLQYTFDPGHGALSMISDLQFLEQMVTKFSDKGADATLDSKFSTYNISSVPQRNAVFTKSKEILNPYPAATFVADYTSIDGVGHWRTPELAAAAASHGGMGPYSACLNVITTTIQSQLKKSSQNFNEELLNTLLNSDSKTKQKDTSTDLLQLLSKQNMFKSS